MKSFILDAKEYYGIKNGQDAYMKIKDDLSLDGNLVVFPSDIEILPSFIRGFMGIRDDNLYIKFYCDNCDTQSFLDKWTKEFQHLRGDPRILEPSKKRKK